MRECTFKHIPNRLLWGQSPICKIFFEEERLFWRAKNKKKQSEPPYTYFGDVSLLVEQSVNRSGINNSFSQVNDVLLCIDEAIDSETYPNAHVVIMKVFLDSINNFFHFTLKDGVNVEIKLEHDPLPCNYAHSMFRTYFDNELITEDKFYEKRLNKGGIGKQYRKSVRDIFNKLTIAIQG